MDELNQSDIDLLLKSLESHKSSGAMGRAMGSMLGAVLARNDDDREKMRAAEEKKEREFERSRRQISEDCALLEAKLIFIRRGLDSRDAGRVLSDAKSQDATV